MRKWRSCLPLDNSTSEVKVPGNIILPRKQQVVKELQKQMEDERAVIEKRIQELVGEGQVP